MSIEKITSVDSGRRKRMRVGRGPGSGKGKTAGRGEKGQTSRSGGGPSPLYEGGQFPFWQRIPKRGFTNARHSVRYQPVRLSRVLERIGGDTVDLETLVAAGLARAREQVKLLGNDAVDRKLTVRLPRISAAARAAIEAAGGSVEELDARG